MRFLEVVLIAVAVPLLALAGAALRRAPGWLYAEACALVLLAGVQIRLEGSRWQMWPAYLAVALLALLCLTRASQPWLHMRVMSLGLAALAAMALPLSLLYPVFRLPVPGGPYAIGTVTFRVVDESRADPYSANPAPRREMVAQFWYPAVRGAKGPMQPYRTAQTASFRDGQLRLVRTHAIAGARLSAVRERYPVILYSPSWHGLRNQSMVQVEELASRGFVVVGIDHPYGSSVTVFPDGRAVYARPSGFLDVASDESVAHSEKNNARETRIRAADAVSVLNFLETLRDSSSGLSADRLDLNHVGIYGYSFGGAVATQACWMDARFQACANLDGDLFAEAYRDGIHQPMLLISDDQPPPSERQIAAASPRMARYLAVDREQTLQVRSTTEKHGGFLLGIHGAEHGNFSDGSLFSPIAYLTDAGPADPRRVDAIINAYLGAFFRQYLYGSQEPLLSGDAYPFPDAHLEIFPPPKSD